MAVDPDLVDQITSSIADLYRQVETALITTVAQRLRQDPPLPSPFQEGKLDAVTKLRRSAATILASLQAARARVIRQAVADAYGHGYGTALADLPEGWFPKSGVGQQARQAIGGQLPNAAVIERLAQALHADVGRVDANILRAPVDAYRAVQAGAAARIATGAYTRREASQAAWQRLMDKGIVTFTDRAGRVWRLSSYVEMIGRTNIARAALQGQTDRLTSIGLDLVIVSDHGQECSKCRPYEGKVLALSGPTGRIEVEHATRDGVMVTVDVVATLDQARADGFQHPNCRHSVSAFQAGITKQPKHTADPQGDKARQKQRALERKIRAAKEQARGALTPEAEKEAGANVRAAQAQLRDHLAANPKLKRLRYREQIGAGNLPKSGGPSGGPVDDLQPPVQPTLDGGPGAQAPVPRDLDVPGRTPKVPGQLSLDDAPEAAPKPKPQAAKPAEPKKPEVPVGARPYHRNLDGIEDLARRVEQPVTETRRLGGLSAQTELQTLADGAKVIRKSQRAGMAESQDAAAEHLSSLVARKLGLRAPRVYRRDAESIYMEYVADGVTADEAAVGRLAGKFATVPDSDHGRIMGLLDLLINNVDRNAGNWMLDKAGDLVPIDHGMAYGEFIERGMEPTFEWVHSPFAAHYKDPDTDQPKANPLTAADVAEVRKRLEELRPDFAHVGREHWLDYSLRMLDVLAEHAAGDRNLIAGVR